MTRPQKTFVCHGCAKPFPNTGAHHKWCSLECACWARIDIREPDECWPWMGAKTDVGYGHFGWEDGPNLKAHRIAYETRKGPLGKLYACHTCDNPICCNPAHIFAGTQSENLLDMYAKGRGNRPHRAGSTHPNAKLTEAKVVEIRRRHTAGESYSRLAKHYDVTSDTIGAVVRRKLWKHVA